MQLLGENLKGVKSHQPPGPSTDGKEKWRSERQGEGLGVKIKRMLLIAGPDTPVRERAPKDFPPENHDERMFDAASQEASCRNCPARKLHLCSSCCSIVTEIAIALADKEITVIIHWLRTLWLYRTRNGFLRQQRRKNKTEISLYSVNCFALCGL